MIKPFGFLGSLRVAVPLLVTLAGVLAWGTFYESRFGTAAVQRFVYQAGWFQAVLAFLAVNLAVAASLRFPWKRKHLPFVLAHIGIILILAGGIIGGRLGIQGQMVIPEGESSDTLLLDRNVLAVTQPGPGLTREFRTRFETTAWNHAPHALFESDLDGDRLQLVVDRYFPNAQRREEISDAGDRDNPAVHIALSADGHGDEIWLLARDRDRFGARWGQAHLLFLQADSEREVKQILGKAAPADRGIVELEFPELGIRREIPVPAGMGRSSPIRGTPYAISFKGRFWDFGLDGKRAINRSDKPNNPAVAFTLTGPEGTDAHLLFSLHPEFPRMHQSERKIHARVGYSFGAGPVLPPDSILLVRTPGNRLIAVLTDPKGKREPMDPIRVGQAYQHPSLGIRFELLAFYPRARVEESFTNRDDEVRSEALHLTARVGERTAQAWLGLRDSAALPLGKNPVTVEYRPAILAVPFSVKLLDFRKTDYPGTEMAAAFESDVELTDPEQGVTFKKKISMNNPLKYRGYSLFQSSFMPGAVETTVLSVRKDPGVPFVYAGFLIVLAGVITLFTSRAGTP